MDFGLFCARLNVLLLFLALSYPFNFIQSPMDIGSLNYLKSTSKVFGGPMSFLESTSSASMDFGRFVFNNPSAVLRPKSPRDIADLLRVLSASSAPKVTVAAKGAGHSIHGQAQALDGIVIEMDSLPSSIHIYPVTDGDGLPYADVSGGALWIELLEESLKLGLAPRSWTDYLYLSVGGTLSNAGISGQTFKYGPQISNVLQLEVVTGQGELMSCSTTKNADLFYAVLGGLGQFGIITSARILLQNAPQKVKWVRAFYEDFLTFTKDQELLISVPEIVDYLEGFIVLNENSIHGSSVAFPAQLEFITELQKDSSKVYYCIEFAVHDYQVEGTNVEDVVEGISSKLSYRHPFIYSMEISYYDFLNRVRLEEMSLRSRGLWDIRHPWLNMFVPKSGIRGFKDLLLESISKQDFVGPILIYPLLKDKWEANTSVVLPEPPSGSAADEEQVVYVVGVLQSVDPAQCSAGCLDELLQRRQRFVEVGIGPIGAKQYLGHQRLPAQWREHFGRRWNRFVERKSRFDPISILGPGQEIFERMPAFAAV